MDNYAEEIPEAMEVDSQQEELKNEERIAALEAELKQEKQKVQLYKINSPWKDSAWQDSHMTKN